jgi:hypothetical protein
MLITLLSYTTLIYIRLIQKGVNFVQKLDIAYLVNSQFLLKTDYFLGSKWFLDNNKIFVKNFYDFLQ